MQKTKKHQLARDLVHALRGELTIYNFANTAQEKDAVVLSMIKLIDRADILMRIQDVEIKHTHLNFDEIVKGVYEKFAEERLQLSLASNIVHGDKDLLVTMLEELISNALRFTEGDVFVSTHFTNKNIVFRIEDIGEGISKAVLAHMGEPFVASDDDRSGHGLGLSIVWAIVQLHGGAMTIHSDKDSGTTILITLDNV